jgi:hypothetical protein
MRTNELSEKDMESLSEESLETVYGGLMSAIGLSANEEDGCISQL